MRESGQIFINTENILPIIKKWLYSEKEIFVRELVSNATDAILKLEKISLVEDVGERRSEPRIEITIDEKEKTISFSDTGLGMTTDEVKKYINQVAFSGVRDFVEKYQGKDDADQVIGHFGLGFYSSFMVAKKVEIQTLSYAANAEPVHWVSSGDAGFEIDRGDRTNVGTTITLHISDDSHELLNETHLKSLVRKYCAFMKYPVFVHGEQMNDPRPIWTQNAAQLQDKDYQDFFAKLFPADDAPLFWVHLNLDFPMKLRGVLFFPKLGHELSASEGQVKLFCNQVFVEDNCKELIPEYLTVLKGVIDCPDLPLNVSRSALQKDDQVRKIAQHITKKIADKFTGLFKTKREEYESFWEDINPFVKYAMMRDSDFRDRMVESVVYKTTAGKFMTLGEYIESFGAKTQNKILYVADQGVHVHLVKMLQHEGVEAIIANRVLDQHFLPYLEMSLGGKYRFERADADVSRYINTDAGTELVDPNDQKTPSQKLIELFRKHLGQENLKVRVEAFKVGAAPAVIVVNENMRRLAEMTRTGQGASALGMMMPNMSESTELVINKSSGAIKNLLNLASSFNREAEVKMLVEQIYDLAMLQQGQFRPESMQAFIERSSEILAKVSS